MEYRNRSRIIFGGILILLGIFLLFGQFVDSMFHIRIGQYTWPFAILVPGVLLYLMAFATDDSTSRNLVTAGSIITGVGLLLFLQNLTNLWATWAYAWAFIFPTSVGVGQMVFGLLRQQEDMRREGWRLTRTGLFILLVGIVFFELLIGISGFPFFGLRGYCFPAVLVIIGLALILRYLLPGQRPAPSVPSSVAPANPPAAEVVIPIEESPIPPGDQDSAASMPDPTTWEAGSEDKTE